MSQLSVDQVDKQSGSTLTLGGAGTTVAVHASATTSGFGSPAYASNASATDDTVNVDASDNLQFNSGYGSTATAYGVRAWVNFNGTGTVAIRDSGNVSSITDNGSGVYTVNFATAFPDTDYACVGAQSPAGESHGNHSNVNVVVPDGLAKTTSSQGINCRYVHGYANPIVVSVAVFR